MYAKYLVLSNSIEQKIQADKNIYTVYCINSVKTHSRQKGYVCYKISRYIIS